jgi:hypothetical protein
MARWWVAWTALAALQVAGVAHAHGTTIPHDLAGVRLCVDDDSLLVAFERGGEAARVAVTQRLERALEQVLGAAAVPWRREERCPDADGYLSVGLVVEGAPWFAPRASAYTLTVQVGPRTRGADGVVRAQPASAFDLSVAEVFDERAVGVPAVVFLPRYVEAGLRDLSVSWWEDHLDAAAAARAVPAWLPWLGAALAASVAALTWWWLRARRRVRPERA